MKDTFVSYGVDKDDAEICADVLIASDKRGIDSHGIGRLKPIYCERMDAKILKAKSKLTFVSQTPTTAVVDGDGGIGLSYVFFLVPLNSETSNQTHHTASDPSVCKSQLTRPRHMAWEWFVSETPHITVLRGTMD